MCANTHAHKISSKVCAHILACLCTTYMCTLAHTKHTQSCILTSLSFLLSLHSLTHTYVRVHATHMCTQMYRCLHSGPYSHTCTQHTLLHSCLHTKMYSHILIHAHRTIHTLQSQADMFKIAHLLIKSSLFILHQN